MLTGKRELDVPAYNTVSNVIQVVAIIATFATFLRTIEEQKLSMIFTVLPGFLVVLYVLRNFTPMKEDTQTIAMLTGAATGVMAGFLSSMTKETFSEKRAFDLKKEKAAAKAPIMPSTTANIDKLHVFYHFELFHFPVVLGAVIYSYCLVFDSLPSPRSTRLASAGAIAASMFVTTLAEFTGNTYGFYDPFKIFFVTFLLCFLLGLILVIKPPQRPWIVSVIFSIIIIIWEKQYFDNLAWDWDAPSFPIPGTILGLCLIFLVRTHVFSTYKPFSKTESQTLLSPLNQIPAYSSDVYETFLNCLSWHTVAFIIERISLAAIQATQKKVFASNNYTDTSLCCINMMVYLFIMSPYFQATVLTKLFILFSVIILHISLSMIQGTLVNHYFIEMCLGLNQVAATNAWLEYKQSQVSKLTHN